MKAELETIKLFVAAMGAYVLQALGGWDALLQGLCVLIVLDYTGGIIVAALTGRLSSKIGFRGILKKSFYFVLIAGVQALENALLPSSDLARNTITAFLAINECVSLFEHGNSLGLLLPQRARMLISSLCALRRQGR